MSADPTAYGLRARFYDRLAEPAREAVVTIVDAGARAGGVYAAGGVVRDLLLKRVTGDIDLVTEGDAIEIVRRALPEARITAHVRFRTASLHAGRVRIDVATARSETYDRPAALPRVRPADIETDLRRRDFSINAIGLRLDADAILLDPCDGQADVERRVVRVLHNRSFVEDPTRIFRAFRYAARLDFVIHAHTRALFPAAIRWIDSLSGERVRRETELLIAEATGGEAMKRCDGEGVLGAVHNALHWDAGYDAALDDLARLAPRIPLGFALLASRAIPAGAAAIVARMKLRRDQAAAVTGIASLATAAEMLRRPGAKPSGVVVLLDRFPPAAVAALAATSRDSIVQRVALRYLEEWRRERPILTGDDLQALGVPPGPQVGRGLQLIRVARLDGWAKTRSDEEALAARLAKSIRDSGAMNADIHPRLNGK